MPKYQTLRQNILLLLIIISLQVKYNISNLGKIFDFHRAKPAALVTKAEFKQDKKVKLQAFGLSYFRGKSHFEDYGMQKLFGFSASLQVSQKYS